MSSRDTRDPQLLGEGLRLHAKQLRLAQPGNKITLSEAYDMAVKAGISLTGETIAELTMNGDAKTVRN